MLIFTKTPRKVMDWVGEPIVVAILAKDKAHVLPLYLECLLQQTFPKQFTHLYIRTNDSTDDTESVLKTFTETFGRQYASVFFDGSSVSTSLLAYGQHEWCPERFHALAAIRQASVNHAISMNAHYFVCDCDNFITKDCLMEMYTLRQLNAVVGPFLRSATNYANYHFGVDSNGYYTPSCMYNTVLSRKIRGIIEVAVVHCTYFIPASVTKAVSYEDASERHEYVIFSEALRRQGILQLLDTRKVYGYLTFTSSLEDFQREYHGLSRTYLTYEASTGPDFPFSTNRLPTLIVSPQAGFGNRVRAMCGALLLAEKAHITLAHCWHADDSEHVDARIQTVSKLGFEYFFEPNPRVPSLPIFENNLSCRPCIAYTEWMPGNYWYTYQSKVQRRFNADTLLPADSIVHKAWPEKPEEEEEQQQPCILETSHNVMAAHVSRDDIGAVYKKYFVPRTRFRSVLAPMAGVVGCSIRAGGDFACYFPDAVFSVEKLKAVICALEVPVVLFSDDVVLRDQIRGCLKHAFVPPFESDARPPADIAFLEFLTLSACDIIYATAHSSFAEEAAKFGNTEYIAL